MSISFCIPKQMASSRRASKSLSAGRASARGSGSSDKSAGSTARSRRARSVEDFNPLVPSRTRANTRLKLQGLVGHTMRFEEHRGLSSASANKRALARYDPSFGLKMGFDPPAGLLHGGVNPHQFPWAFPEADESVARAAGHGRYEAREYFAKQREKYNADREARLERPVRWVQDRWRYLRQRPYMPIEPLTRREREALTAKGVNIVSSGMTRRRPYDVLRARHEDTQSRRPPSRRRKPGQPVRKKRG